MEGNNKEEKQKELEELAAQYEKIGEKMLNLSLEMGYGVDETPKAKKHLSSIEKIEGIQAALKPLKYTVRGFKDYNYDGLTIYLSNY